MSRDKKVFEAMRKLVPESDDQLNMCATMFGVSAALAMFIFKHRDFIHIPDNVSYAMSLMAANMFALKKGKQATLSPDLGLENLPCKEKLLMILRMLIENYKDDL